ncbi:MAG: small acid-soluble spore protein SspI [Bacilli bacterium]
MDMRKYIINNFKDDDVSDIKDSIDSSIASMEEEPLIGLGVLFELAWKNANSDEQLQILKLIKLGLNKKA